jgi:hypothetical protein
MGQRVEWREGARMTGGPGLKYELEFEFQKWAGIDLIQRLSSLAQSFWNKILGCRVWSVEQLWLLQLSLNWNGIWSKIPGSKLGAESLWNLFKILGSFRNL